MQGIYRIRNKLDDMRYVGSTNNFEKGWIGRRKALRKGKYLNTHLQRAWNKYGEGNFVFEIEEEVIGNTKALLDVEQAYLDVGFELGILYNVARTAGGGNLGEEVNRKIGKTMSKVMKGKPKTKEHRAKLSRSQTGRKHTKETKAKMSKAKTGKNNPMYGKTGEMNPNYGSRRSEETKAKQRKAKLGENNPFFGKHHTEKVKREQSEQMLGQNNPMYGKTGKDNPHYGKKRSAETRARMSEANLGENNPMYGISRTGEAAPFYGRHHTEETKIKMTKAHKGHKYAAKSYPAFYNTKSGEFISPGYNLKELCEEKELAYQNMAGLRSGKTKQTRNGWKLAE